MPPTSTHGTDLGLPVCAFCRGSGTAPVDTRDFSTDRVAAIARFAATNQIWDWSGRPRPRGGVEVEAPLAQRIADAIEDLHLDGDRLDSVLRRVGADHGLRTLHQVLAFLGRAAA